MDSGITYPFIKNELDQRRGRARSGAAVRRHRGRTGAGLRLTRTDGNR